MPEHIEDLTVSYSEGGKELVQELDKVILSKGAWATIIFRYRDWEEKSGGFGPDRFTIRRYRKRGGEYAQQSRFNISSRDQAAKIIAALQKWMAEPGE